jgi:hypothetical protein
MDRNMMVLSGVLAGVSQRSVGAQGRSLHELKITVTKPATRGREAETMTVPVIVWARDTACRQTGRPSGWPLTPLRTVVSIGPTGYSYSCWVSVTPSWSSSDSPRSLTPYLLGCDLNLYVPSHVQGGLPV